MTKKNLGKYHFRTDYNQDINFMYDNDSRVWTELSPTQKMKLAGFLWSLGSDHNYIHQTDSRFKTKIDRYANLKDKTHYKKPNEFGKKSFRTNYNQFISKGFNFYKSTFPDVYEKIHDREFARELLSLLARSWSHGSDHAYHASKKTKYNNNSATQP